jgi:mannose-6-phosphate isomerase
VSSVQPVVLAPNLPETFYRGSGRLAAFRGLDLPPRPEDWVGSTTARFGQAPSGLSPLPDGTLLADAVTADPLGWLGAEHLDRFGAETGVLVKLLDAGQRLPVHVHPSRDFARSHLARPYGKSEAWIIVDAAPGARVHLGFSRDVPFAELDRWVAEQDVRALLSATNALPVAAGDVLFCPAGAPHAIGAEILLVELQEPTDFSVLLEQEGFPVTADDAMLGLPRDVALECVDRGAFGPERLSGLRGGSAGSLLPAAAEAFFTARLLEGGDRVTGFAVLVAVDGSGALVGDWGRSPVARGTTVALPFGAGAGRLEGEVRVVRCGPGTSAP